jgi:hypothetical protein
MGSLVAVTKIEYLLIISMVYFIFSQGKKNRAIRPDFNKAFACGEKASPPVVLICAGPPCNREQL